MNEIRTSLPTESKRGSYKANKFLIDENGKLLGVGYENDKIKIESPKDRSYEQLEKSNKKKENRSIVSEYVTNLIDSNFYFYFYNEGLDSIDTKEIYKLRFLYLCTYAGYYDKKNGGAYIGHRNGNRFDKKKVKQLLGVSENKANDTIKELLKVELLIEDKEGFKVNSKYVKRGNLTSKEKKKQFTRVFNNGLRELYNNCKPTQHGQLYYLFKMLPYVNTKFNAICQNPNETIDEKVIPLKLSEICEVTNYDVSKAKRFEKEMLKLEVFGQYALAIVINGSGTCYKINPQIMYAGNTVEDTEALNELLTFDFKAKK
ncbi:hypothetical protein PBV87_08060 [Niameybacter massiliensis]|uniref:Uncharacterized protein n=1 Tax=Holtiella tumoricola TaxID=3018743 RepID=A0AA42DLT7_9FIRM|nr:hypothetical protein [Holtiella tumoricola]MDA3731429.1 hypothetical protein [Holtiella tumoricola]